MARFFHTAGPCVPGKHYMLPAEARLGDVRAHIHNELYFVVHAPRQTGKTTSFLELTRSLNAEGNYVALHASCERGQTAGPDIAAGVDGVILGIEDAARLQLPEALRPPMDVVEGIPPESRLARLLMRWSERCRPKDIVLFLDEVDALRDESFLSILRQLRSNYPARPEFFPRSIALVGMRDVRDYKIKLRPERETLGTASPFNISVRSLRLQNFTAAEVATLLHQHTEETGQVFEPDAIARIADLTRGQPWLVNALASRATDDLVPNRSQPITRTHVDQAKEIIIQERHTHIDSLVDKLREPRVRRILEPILTGEVFGFDLLEDDVRYVEDLGLITTRPVVAIANPIYREVIPRALSWTTQITIPDNPAWFVSPTGRLSIDKLLEGFAEFWREHAEALISRQPYPEAAPHLVFLAYLQRIVNGGGTIDREYAVGRGRMDLLIGWPTPEGLQREAIEIKVWRDKKRDPLAKGLEQLAGYLRGLSLTTGTLIIFDRRSDLPDAEERTTLETLEHEGLTIRLLRA